jgi:hypothetical protein
MRTLTGMNQNEFRVDRKAFSVVSLKEQEEADKRYWRDKSPRERLEAVEITRQLLYGYDPASARLQRVLEIAERS